MIQKHKILLTLDSDATTISSPLQSVNGYEVNNTEGLGLGIVNPSNVRVFLNDDVNRIIIRDFYSYLTATTTTVEFSEIFYSDEKLSNVFNNYYNSTILLNQFPPTSVIDESLSGTSGVTIIQNEIFNYNGVAPGKGLQNIPFSINDSTRDLKVYSALTTFTLEPSYYIPVFVRRNYSQTDRENAYFDEILNVLENFIPVTTGKTQVSGLNPIINIPPFFNPSNQYDNQNQDNFTDSNIEVDVKSVDLNSADDSNIEQERDNPVRGDASLEGRQN